MTLIRLRRATLSCLWTGCSYPVSGHDVTLIRLRRATLSCLWRGGAPIVSGHDCHDMSERARGGGVRGMWGTSLAGGRGRGLESAAAAGASAVTPPHPSCRGEREREQRRARTPGEGGVRVSARAGVRAAHRSDILLMDAPAR